MKKIIVRKGGPGSGHHGHSGLSGVWGGSRSSGADKGGAGGGKPSKKKVSKPKVKPIEPDDPDYIQDSAHTWTLPPQNQGEKKPKYGDAVIGDKTIHKPDYKPIDPRHEPAGGSEGAEKKLSVFAKGWDYKKVGKALYEKTGVDDDDRKRTVQIGMSDEDNNNDYPWKQWFIYGDSDAKAEAEESGSDLGVMFEEAEIYFEYGSTP